MREVLFRGKRADSGKWIYGYYAVIGERHVIIKALSEDYYSVDVGVKKSHGNEVVEVKPETICQYTGLTDRNGRKIFEGNIVNCNKKRGAAFWHCKVVWNEENARFDVINGDCGFPMCTDGYGSDIFVGGSDYEVIGNIFDNPELDIAARSWKCRSGLWSSGER